jgi:hypothetical protein
MKWESIKVVPTRLLLSWLNAARVKGSGSWWRSDYYLDHVPGVGPKNERPTFDEIKAELSTREHIPNKKEAKKIRQKRGER